MKRLRTPFLKSLSLALSFLVPAGPVSAQVSTVVEATPAPTLVLPFEGRLEEIADRLPADEAGLLPALSSLSEEYTPSDPAFRLLVGALASDEPAALAALPPAVARAAARIRERARQDPSLAGAIRDLERLAKSAPTAPQAPLLPRHVLSIPLDFPAGEASPALSATQEAGASPFAMVPVSKRVGELQVLTKTDPEAALTLAVRHLTDSSERRFEVRIAATRTLASVGGPSRIVPVLLDLTNNDARWGVRRLAAKVLGDMAGAPDVPANDIVASLQKAYQDKNASVRNTARRGLERFGVQPAPPPAPKAEAPQPAPQQQASEPPPSITRPPSFGRILAILAAGFLGTALLFGLAQSVRTAPVQPDAGVTQTVDAGPDATKTGSVATAQPAAPVDPTVQAINNLDQDVKRLADAQEKQTKLEEEAAKKAEEERKSYGFTTMLIQWLPLLLLLVVPFLMFRRMQRNAAGGAAQLFKKKPSWNKFMQRPKTRFSDVAGIDEVAGEIQEIGEFLTNPGKFKKTGARIPKGALLIGEPGGGKTLIAKALAGETQVPFFPLSGSDFVEMFVGVGASRARDLFDTAKKNAPSIIFIDEIDAVGKARRGAGLGTHDEQEQTLNQILKEMDGFDNSDGVVVLGATNRPEILDPALKRPGRFDRQIYVRRPDTLGREAILNVHAENVPLDWDVDLESVAQQTSGLTGAFLENIINEAALLAARRNADTISRADVDQAINRVTIGAASAMFVSEEQKRKVAYHEAGHLVPSFFSKDTLIRNKVTIVPHGPGALGFASFVSEQDILSMTKTEMEARILSLMGGAAAEKLIYGEISTGPYSDFEVATQVARDMAQKYGMSETLGYAVTAPDPKNPFAPSMTSEETKREIDLEVRRILKEKFQQAESILTEHRAELEALAQAFLQKETLYREEIEAIVLGPRSNSQP